MFCGLCVHGKAHLRVRELLAQDAFKLMHGILRLQPELGSAVGTQEAHLLTCGRAGVEQLKNNKQTATGSIMSCIDMAESGATVCITSAM